MSQPHPLISADKNARFLTEIETAAGWTFMLNTPVVCMHGMRTAVNRIGPAPYVLLIVPPVILWMVNYIHLAILLILER
jgi:ESS family glutamate:Na+ symporter